MLGNGKFWGERYLYHVRDSNTGELEALDDVELASDASRIWKVSGYSGSTSDIATSLSNSTLGKGTSLSCFLD